PAFLQQLDKMNLAQSSILYYKTNDAGEITDLILDDITGECYAYGIVTKAESNTSGMRASGSYTYDIKGVSGVFSSSGKSYAVATGQPVMMRMADGKPQNIMALTKLSANIKTVTERSLVSITGTEYLISDDVAIYLKRSYDYTTLPISELQKGSYRMTAYHDKSMEKGGRIRVIVAEPKE
ncbi:MAG: hypothetical protein IKL80_03075, partial [Clostridia bacterium]|nr:hypothetical protein [Clostridia bacterium]